MNAPSLTILEGDCIEQLKTLPDESVHCVVTSPPYWGLRDYGVDGQIGLEPTPEAYVFKIVEVFREVRRVLRSDGTCWMNLGSSYAGGQGQKNGEGEERALSGPNFHGGTAHLSQRRTTGKHGFKPKDLVPIPWMVAMALQKDGWWLRQDIIWSKPNPMPESVTDRCTKAHEYVFLLSKSANYFYDAEAVKEPQAAGTFERFGNGKAPRKVTAKSLASEAGEVLSNSDYKQACPDAILPDGCRNKRSVWTIPSQAYSEAHFATFPEALVKPCILAGTSARGCCPKCGEPWERVVEPTPEYAKLIGKSVHDHKFDGVQTGMRQDGKGPLSGDQTRAACPNGTYQTTGWTPTCDCGCTDTVPCTVIDPFGGSFTTCQVALELGRNAVGIELNPEYVKLARARCAVTPGLALA